LATLDVTEMQSEFVGKVFHFLTVVKVVPFGVRARRLYCQCICGNTTLAKPYELRTKEKTSCGCWKKQVLGESSKTHGRANSRIKGYVNRTYGIWQAMRDRCSNPNRKDYHRYGGRGISVCARWHSFEMFLADMGEAPTGLTLDRKDNNKGYSPENCAWATRNQQAYNSTHMVYIEHEGEIKALKQWQQKMNVKPHQYYSRLKKGWSVKEALLLTKEKLCQQN